MSEETSNKKKGITIVVVLAAVVGVGVTLWPSSSKPVVKSTDIGSPSLTEQRQVSDLSAPRKVEPVFVYLDVDAENILDKTRELSVETLTAEVAGQKAKTRQSNQTVSESEDVRQALGLDQSIPQTAMVPAAQSSRDGSNEVVSGLLHRVQLRSLISVDGKTTAWISLGNNDPVPVHPKMKLASLVIENISSQGVSVREGSRSQFFPRRFYSINKAITAQPED